MIVLVDVDPLMRLNLAMCLTGTPQSPSLTVFSWVDVSITRTTYCFESLSKLFILAGFCCSQSLPDVFQPLLSDHPFQPFLSIFFPFCCSTVCRTELGRMTCFCTIVTDATEPSTFALPFAFLHGVQFTIWTSWCVGITNVPILSPLCCVLTIIQIWITVRPLVCNWRGTLTAGVCPNSMFSDVNWCNAGCVVSDENNDLIFQIVGSTLSSSTCVSIARRQNSGTTLMYAALTMALRTGSFRDCRANTLTNFLITFSKWIDSAIWVGRFNSWSWLAMTVAPCTFLP